MTPLRVKGALFWALEDGKGSKGHLFLPGETLQKEALRLLNNKIPVPALRSSGEGSRRCAAGHDSQRRSGGSQG